MKRMNKKGFTIVELSIVIAVIAILAAILVPSFSSMVKDAKNTAAKESAKIAYFISRDRQEKLPAWVEPSNKAALTGGGATTATPTMTPAEDLPWN